MISQIEQYILDNWYVLQLNISKPNKLAFLKIGSRGSKNGSVPFLIFGDKFHWPILFMKIPRNPEYTDSIEKEFRNLSQIRQILNSKNLLNSIPKPIYFGKILNRAYLIETSVNGRIFVERITSRFNIHREFKRVLKWITEFHSETKQEVKKIDEDFVKEYIKKPLNLFLRNFNFLDSPFKKNIKKEINSLIVTQKGKNLPIVSQHGDLSPYNIYVDMEKIMVVDWEDALIRSPAYLDLYHFLISCSHAVHLEKDPRENFKKFLVKDNKYKDLVDHLVEEYCSQLNIDIDLFRRLLPLALIQAANRDIELHHDLMASSLNWINRLRIYLQSKI